MAIHSLVTLNSEAATLLSPSGVHSGCDITIQNVNVSGYIYVGNSSVSNTSYGYRILPNHAISFELPGKDALYVVSSAPAMKVAVMITGLESGS